MATRARAKRGSDSPVMKPGRIPASCGWSSSQRINWMTTTSKSRSASNRWPQRTQSVSANSNSSAKSRPDHRANGKAINGGRDRAEGPDEPPRKIAAEQVKQGTPNGGVWKGRVKWQGYGSRVGSTNRKNT